MKLKGRLLIFFLLFSVCLWGRQIQSSEVRLDVRLGFNGYVIPNRWVPLKLKAAGKIESLSVEIQRQDEEGSNQPPELFDLKGENSIECPVFSDYYSSRIKIGLLKNGRVLSTQTLDTTAKTFPGHVILTWHMPAEVQKAIEQILLPEEPVKTVPLELEDLPGTALDYDGISGIVLSDPGAGLTPRQLDAIREWLAGGGKLIMDSVKPFSESIIMKIADVSGLFMTDNNLMIIPAGLGSVTLVQTLIQEQAWAGNPAYWEKLLNLKPYQNPFRLNAARCFPMIEDVSMKINKSRIFIQSAFVFIIWVIIFLFIIIPGTKDLRRKIIGFTVLYSLLIIPILFIIVKEWHRGASVNTMAVILPGNTGIFLNTTILAKPSGIFLLDEAKVSPWPVNISFGINDNGQIHPGSKTIWRHRTEIAAYSLRYGDPDYLNLMSSLPCRTGSYDPDEEDIMGIPDIIRPEYPVTLFKNNSFWSMVTNEKGTVEWSKMSDPEWLKDVMPWFEHLQEEFPEMEWLAGRGQLASFDLNIMDRPETDVYWIKPVIK